MSNFSVAEEFISTKINKYSIQLLNIVQKKQKQKPVFGWRSRFSVCKKKKKHTTKTKQNKKNCEQFRYWLSFICFISSKDWEDCKKPDRLQIRI